MGNITCSAVADPGFSPGGGAPTPKSAIIFQFFAKNCMKMKEFGPPGGGRASLAPPWIRQCSVTEILSFLTVGSFLTSWSCDQNCSAV